MNKQQIFDYYTSPFITEQLLKNSKGREVAGAFWDGSYDARPNIIQYKTDIAQMAKKGITSFHFSVEHWSNPMALTNENYDKLRTGWDLIIDIDSKLGAEEAKHAAELICKTIEKYGVKNYGIKFSGRRGFHICMPWIMFPKEIDYKQTEKMYPDIPRVVSAFIREKIKDDLMQYLVRTKGAKNLIEMIGEVPESFSPFFFIEIEKDWGNRHMFRAPFSLNEKTWMASVPLSFNQMKNFSMEEAAPEYVISHSNVYDEFFHGQKDEAQDLIMDAMDWATSMKKEEKKEVKQKIIVWDKKIVEEYFPPCIKNMLSGLADGRKRSVFILVNFLRMMNWNWSEIEEKIFEWNDKNKPPLMRNIILGQLRWSQRNERNPSNCPPDGDLFYTDTRICAPDAICKQGGQKIAIKNPVVYPFKVMKKQRKERKDFSKISRGYSCGSCDKQFKNMRSLNLHKARMHGYVFDSEI